MNARLERVFERCFAREYRTRLVGGAGEPFYRPAHDKETPHMLFYREDFFASALHETAHWCIAGAARRRLPDFGYWYAPEGRDRSEQRAFEAVEAEPQALEWLFSLAAGSPFRLSLDNLDGATGEPPDACSFAALVLDRARHWQRVGPPVRAGIFYAALCTEFGTRVALPGQRLALGDILP